MREGFLSLSYHITFAPRIEKIINNNKIKPMEHIVNHIFYDVTGIKNESFFEKKILINKYSEKINKRIEKITNILKKWFSGNIQYNYDSFIEYKDKFLDFMYFYILYNNKLYGYRILFKDEEIINIKNLDIYIIKPPYYTQIDYKYVNKYYVGIIKPKLYSYDKILSNEYNKDKTLNNSIKLLNPFFSKKIIIKNYNIEEVHYIFYSDVCKKDYKINYIYIDNYIYHYKKIPDIYIFDDFLYRRLKFNDNFRIFILFK